MNRQELDEAFRDALKEVGEDPEGFVISHVAAMSSMVMLRAALLAIIENPSHAKKMAVYALDQVEEFTPHAIARSLGMSSFGETVN